MIEMWNNFDPAMKQVLIVFAIIMPIYLVGMNLYLKKKRGNAVKWLEQHPDAAKIFLETKSNLIKNNTLNIIAVDDADPVIFYENGKSGFYMTAGTHIVTSSFSSSRPGVLHRNVTTTYAPTKQELVVENNKTYTYTFDVKEKTYQFIEH